MKKFVAAAFLLVLHTELNAMTVAAFLQRAEALEARGALAMFSSELNLLTQEIRAAGQAARAEQAAAERAGRTPPFCIPATARAERNEVLAYFRAIPQAQRHRMEVREAFRGLMIRKYPCSS